MYAPQSVLAAWESNGSFEGAMSSAGEKRPCEHLSCLGHLDWEKDSKNGIKRANQLSVFLRTTTNHVQTRANQ